MWPLFVVVVLSLCLGLEGQGIHPGYKQQFEDVMRYHRSINRFYQDWLDNSYHEANLTAKQKAYYNSLLPRRFQDRGAVTLPKDLELFYKINEKEEHSPTLLSAVMKLFQHLESELDQYLTTSHRQRRDADDEMTKAEKRKERQEMRKEIQAQGKKAWRDYLKQQRQNRRDRGKFYGANTKEAKREKWLRKMENKNGNGAPPPTNEQPPPAVNPPVAAPPPPPVGSPPPIPPIEEEPPKEAIPIPNPDDEEFPFENEGPPPPKDKKEKPNEDNKPQNPKNEVKQFEGSPPPPGNSEQPAPPPPPSDAAPPQANEDIKPKNPEDEKKQFEAPPPPGQGPPNPGQNPPNPGNNPPAPPPPGQMPPLPEFKEDVPFENIPVNTGDEGDQFSRRRRRSLTTRRPEYNHLSEAEYKRFLVALKQLLSTRVDGLSQYQVFVKSHRLLESPQAYSQNSYMWNKYFIQRFEAALRQYDSSVTLPYLDVCSFINNPSPRLLGGLPDQLPVIKECSWIGANLKRTILSSNVTTTKLSDILGCTSGSSSKSLSVEDFATLHAMFGECTTGGSHLACPSCAVADPLYWLIYADVDRILTARNT